MVPRRRDTPFEPDSHGGQGGFEIRTWVAIAGACEGAKGNLWCYEPIPDYAVGCTIAKMEIK